MPTHHHHTPIEWVAGLVELPDPVFAAGVERTHLMLIVTLAGKATGALLHAHQEVLLAAPSVLARAMATPNTGTPPVGPLRLRVADESLAEALGNGLPPNVTLVAGATPEIDDAVERVFAGLDATDAMAELPRPSRRSRRTGGNATILR